MIQNNDIHNHIYDMVTGITTLHKAERCVLDADLQTLEHCNATAKAQLLQTLSKHPTLFGEGLGRLNVKLKHVKPKPGATPYHVQPFPVKQSLYKPTKTEKVNPTTYSNAAKRQSFVRKCFFGKPELEYLGS